ncbi:MAG: hypothetical protein IK031_02625 [Bacteroidales bacterium]|nr:hypothetical protein [Bacteroidales bacterium]
MKRINSVLKIAAILLTAAATLTACRTERSGEPDFAQKHDIRTVVFHALEVPTRTAFGPGQDGTYPTLWTSNDAAVKLALNYTEAAEAAVVPSANFLTATFTADIDATGKQAPYTFYAVSPASAARALSPSRQAWNISIPADQTPLEGSVDESAQILAAASQPSDVVPSDVDLHFRHLTAYGRMSFKNLTLGDAVVDRVEITATTPLVGDWYWDSTGEGTLTDNGASSTITLRTSRTTDIWFACAPVDMSEEIAVITVYTDQGALVKEVEFPQGRKFQSGHIAVFSVDMSGIELAAPASDGFELIKDASLLQPGDQIIILDAKEKYAIGTNQKPYNRAAAAISVSDHTVSAVPSDVQVITLESGNSGSTWYMSVEDGYLANANGNKNKLLTIVSKTNNALWDISIASSGVATVKAGSGERANLRFNDNDSSNLLFSCYSSGQNDVVIYRKGGSGGSGPVLEDPLTDESGYGIYLSDKYWRYIPGEDQYTRSYSSSGEQTFTLLYPEDKEQLEIIGYRKSLVKGDKCTITVNWRVGTNRLEYDAKFPVTVVKEEGPKVWLSIGGGYGFIIKK